VTAKERCPICGGVTTIGGMLHELWCPLRARGSETATTAAALDAKNARLRALDNAVRWLRGIRWSPDFRKDGGGRSYGELLDYIYGVFEAAAGCGEDKQ